MSVPKPLGNCELGCPIVKFTTILSSRGFISNSDVGKGLSQAFPSIYINDFCLEYMREYSSETDVRRRYPA